MIAMCGDDGCCLTIIRICVQGGFCYGWWKGVSMVYCALM